MSDSSTSTILYKILTEDEYAALYTPNPPTSRWPGSALDRQDGFLHTSSSTQVGLSGLSPLPNMNVSLI